MIGRVEREAALIGFHRVRGTRGDFRDFAWEITCSRCTKAFQAHWPANIPPGQMLKNMRTRHWDVGKGLRPLCEECRKIGNKAPLAKPEDQSFERFVPPEPTTQVYHALLAAAEKTGMRQRLVKRFEAGTDALLEAQHSYEQCKEEVEQLRRAERAARKDERKQHREAKRQARLAAEAEIMERKAHIIDEENNMGEMSLKITHTIFQLLDSVFDATKRLYRSGYSDEVVAKDCGTTVEIVAKLRREVYGELAEDPRITTISDDVKLFEMQVAEFTKNAQAMVRDLNSRLDQLKTNLAR
jgi:hypothetical protein